MTAPIVFLDTETTGLTLDDDIWEFAAIRREPDGTETGLHLFIEHDVEKCHTLPDSFRRDHLERWPSGPADVTSQFDAAAQIHSFILGSEKPHIVGAVPNFDTERLTLLFERQFGRRQRDPWHYHLIDVENLAVGYLAAVRLVDPAGAADLAPPWDSDELSRLVGVEPPTDERHTAMGDTRWARAIYDRVMGAPDA